MSDLTTVTLTGTENEATDTAALKSAIASASSSEATIFLIDGFMAIREKCTFNKPIHVVGKTKESGFIMGSKHSGAYPSMTDSASFVMGHDGALLTEADALLKTPGPTEGQAYVDCTNAFAASLQRWDWVMIHSKTPLGGVTPHATNQYPAELHEVIYIGAADSGGTGYTRIYFSTPLIDSHTTTPRIYLHPTYRTLKDIYWENLIFRVNSTRYTGSLAGTGTRSIDTRGVLRPRLIGLTMEQIGAGEILINSPNARADVIFKDSPLFGNGELVWNYGITCHCGAANFEIDLHVYHTTSLHSGVSSASGTTHLWTTGAIGSAYGGNRYGTPNGILRASGQFWGYNQPFSSHSEGKHIELQLRMDLGPAFETPTYNRYVVCAGSRCRNLTVNQSVIRGLPSGGIGAFFQADGCKILNSRIISGFYGVAVHTHCSNTEIKNVIFEDVSTSAIVIHPETVGNGIDIANCYTKRCCTVATGVPQLTKSPIIIKGGSNIRIRNCDLSKTSNPSAQYAIDIFDRPASSVTAMHGNDMDGYALTPIGNTNGAGAGATLWDRVKYDNYEAPTRTDVTYGADDSAGAGYRMVRVPNQSEEEP